MKKANFIMFFSFIVAAMSQRSPYAGQRPIGYPTIETTSTTPNPLGNRFGGDVTTERLPIEALGDRELVNRLSKLPQDKQPFWYINWRALEDLRKNQNTYEQKENPFLVDVNRIQPQNQQQAQAQNLVQNRPINQNPGNTNSWD
ncbi:uncharacterized protein [Epargyreus clarus]|uniref:uncharacterized protein n=1 Tax=Epargyreus clarus TaxID=520877 RepID=UPI003C2D1E9A